MATDKAKMSEFDPNQLRQRLYELVEPVITDHGAELVDIELAGHTNRQILRILVHKTPYITIDLCQAIGLEVGDLLDVEDPMPGRYQLEVTSPGLDRPLVSDRDFARALEHRVKVITQQGQTLHGILISFDRDQLELKGKKAAVHTLERKFIAKATIEAKV